MTDLMVLLVEDSSSSLVTVMTIAIFCHSEIYSLASIRAYAKVRFKIYPQRDILCHIVWFLCTKRNQMLCKKCLLKFICFVVIALRCFWIYLKLLNNFTTFYVIRIHFVFSFVFLRFRVEDENLKLRWVKLQCHKSFVSLVKQTKFQDLIALLDAIPIIPSFRVMTQSKNNE